MVARGARVGARGARGARVVARGERRAPVAASVVVVVLPSLGEGVSAGSRSKGCRRCGNCSWPDAAGSSR